MPRRCRCTRDGKLVIQGLLLWLTGVALISLAGCTTSGGPSAGITSPPPDDLTPIHLTLALMGDVEDTDGNRFPDTITAMVWVQGNHPINITPPGAFTFRLFADDDVEVVRWEITEEMAQAAVADRKLVGPSFLFRLNIRDQLSTDKMQPISLGLSATFVPIIGDPISSGGRMYVQFGREVE